jgi:predicted AAA+ superfamily ATPase
MSFEHSVVAASEKRILRGSPLIQIVIGPRQVGKTTAAFPLEKRLGWPSVVASGDAFPPVGAEWIETRWAWARAKEGERVLLVLDEVQKVRGWSQTVKRLWDEEVRIGGKVQPVLLGSSALTLQEGMAESLAGRFFYTVVCIGGMVNAKRFLDGLWTNGFFGVDIRGQVKGPMMKKNGRVMWPK